ncbi:D-amino acid aminotransferase [Thalassotalea maritima]|uniref:D-amino acid aminotransferase n=1 Tax=Thalassotalea maritima TaxID=3242416 RepID=UPI003527AA61
MNIVYLNGQFVAKQDAKVSVLDRGFLFADGVYEVIPVYNAIPFRLEQHLQRLDYCLSKVNIDNPYSHQQWVDIINKVIRQNGAGHMSIYLQLTRGSDVDRQHVFAEQQVPTVLVMASPLNIDEKHIDSCTATLLDDIRWQHCDVKSIALLANIMLRNEAQLRGYDEAILHRDGLVTEGSTSNVFVVKDSNIYTPKANHFILGGITRDVIIEIAENAGLKVHQQDIYTDDLFAADEVWITSSSREISPVRQIDDKIIGQGNIGPVARALFSKFQAFKRQLTV